MKTLRETDNYIVTEAKRGVRVTAKAKGVTPKSRVVGFGAWDYLKTASDSEFDGSCVLELGIGTFRN